MNRVILLFLLLLTSCIDWQTASNGRKYIIGEKCLKSHTEIMINTICLPGPNNTTTMQQQVVPVEVCDSSIIDTIWKDEI